MGLCKTGALRYIADPMLKMWLLGGGIVLLCMVCLAGAALWYAVQPARADYRARPHGIRHFPHAPALATRARGAVRIVTWNVGYAYGPQNNQGRVLARDAVERNLAVIGGTLAALAPDIVLLQEVDFDAARTFGIDQLARIAEATGLPHAAWAITWNQRYIAWPYWPPRQQFGRIVSGQAVLSRFPIRAHDVHRFPKPAANAFWYNWFYLDRVAQTITMDLGGRTAALLHLHLEAFDNNAQLQQAEWVLGHFADTFDHLSPPDPHILWIAGDLNSVSNVRTDTGLTPEQRQSVVDSEGKALPYFLDNSFPYLFQNAETSAQLTFPSWEPLYKIDHILYATSQVRLIGTGQPQPTTASDHLPLWADFVLP